MDNVHMVIPGLREDDGTPFSQERVQQVAKLMEERRKERINKLTRNLEVCDLLDYRNPQSVAEYAPQIMRFLTQEELNHLYPQDFMVNN